jgi:UDP-N-acetylmuramate dehydrogenase
MDVFAGLEHIVRENEPLAPYSWFRLGGPAQYFAEPTNRAELADLVRRSRDAELPIHLLGGGSNLLVRDKGVAGLVLHLTAPAFGQIAVADTMLTSGGGAKLSHVITHAVREGLAGLEQLVGIPGTVGGALHGNAVGHGSDIGSWTHGATVMTREGEVLTRTREEMRFSHRQSSLDELVILEAKFQLDREDTTAITKRMQKFWIVKKANQPSGEEDTAWIFKNPGGSSAAELIEAAGMKGTHVGEAEVSEKNANFIVAQRGASSADVLKLIDLLRERVAERMGVELELQLNVW